MNVQDLVNLHNQAKEHEVSQEALAILRLCEVLTESQQAVVAALNHLAEQVSNVEMNLRMGKAH